MFVATANTGGEGLGHRHVGFADYKSPIKYEQAALAATEIPSG